MKQWIRYLNSVLKEAHWLNSGCLPKVDEYLNNGIVSPGVHLVLIHAFFLFDHIQDITKETIAILDDDFPNIMYSVTKILRFSDDLEGDKVKLVNYYKCMNAEWRSKWS
jgi:(3S)-linalool synthase